MTGPKVVVSPRRRLADLFDRLGSGQQEQLLDFAEYLAERSNAAAPRVDNPGPPPDAPPDESVVSAIQRLSQHYTMVNKADILHRAAGLMASHVMEGRPAADVIIELEGLFLAEFEARRARRAVSPDHEQDG